MEEMRAAGAKEFFITLAWAFVLFVISQYIGAAMETYHIVATLIGIAMFAVLGFFVLTRYCASFTYTVKDGRVRINRRIGHRNKEVDFAISNIKEILPGNAKVKAKNIYNMSSRVFFKSNSCCMVFNKTGTEEAVIFEPSREMLALIKRQLKKKEDI